MRTKIFQWMMAAIFVCGASVFTSCSSDDNDAETQAYENRTEFIEHCRANLKDLAENLNFGSWEMANTINQNFNEHVLNNPAFTLSIANMFMQQAMQSVQPVEAGSELAQKGYQTYGVVDFTNFNYRFTSNDDGTAFNVEPADDFEMILYAYDKTTLEVKKDIAMKLTLKAGGSSFLVIMKLLSSNTFAIVGKIPTEFTFSIASLINGEWKDIFTGAFKNDVRKDGTSQYIDKMEDAFNLSGTIKSSIPAIKEQGTVSDETTINFAIGQDPATHEAGVQLGYVHNGREIIKVRGVLENLNGMTDYSQFNSSMSIAEMFLNVMAGNNVKEGEFTLLNDLSGTLKVKDCAKVVEIQNMMAHARRNYADEATIEKYTQQLNELVSGTMSCAHNNQQIPWKMQTVKFGVDYWAVPAMQFAAGSSYEPLTDMLDKESIAYMINIADHAAEPMKESLVTVRQLMQYMQKIIGAQKTNP